LTSLVLSLHLSRPSSPISCIFYLSLLAKMLFGSPTASSLLSSALVLLAWVAAASAADITIASPSDGIQPGAETKVATTYTPDKGTVPPGTKGSLILAKSTGENSSTDVGTLASGVSPDAGSIPVKIPSDISGNGYFYKWVWDGQSPDTTKYSGKFSVGGDSPTSDKNSANASASATATAFASASATASTTATSSASSSKTTATPTTSAAGPKPSVIGNHAEATHSTLLTVVFSTIFGIVSAMTIAGLAL